MKKNIIITIIAIVILVSASVYYYISNKNSSQVQFRVEKVSRGDILVNVTATGTVNAVTTVQVGTQVSGTVSKIFVDFNSKVKKGQVIAMIDRTLLEQSVRDAEANLQKAQTAMDVSKRNFDRMKTLMDKGMASQSDYDNALNQFESATADNKQAQASLTRAQINLHYATIVAPIDGVVISRAVDVGQTVAASFSTPTLFSIANDLAKMQVQASVDEADIGKVKVGQDVSFTVDAYPDRTFKGTVTQVRLNPIVAQNVVSYIVIIDVPNEDLKLMPGMTATVTILVDKRENALKIPTIALRFTPPQDLVEEHHDTTKAGSNDSARAERRRQWMQRSQSDGGESAGGGMNVQDIQRRMASRGFARVWKMNDNKKLEPVMVRTGISDGTFTEVVRGKLEEGQEIVVGTMAQKAEAVSGSPFGQQRGRNRF